MAPASRPSGRPSSRPDFEIAIVCALTIEADAVVSLFDDDWDEGDEAAIAPYDKAQGDPNAYSAGRVGRHNVVVAHMPGMGKANAATVAAHCRTSWPNIRLALVVGICGAVPFPPHSEIEIILGDVVISDAVVQYDLGRRLPEQFTRKDTLTESLSRPTTEIRALLSKLKGRKDRKKLLAKMGEHLTHLQKEPELKASYPGAQKDRLFDAKYRHVKDGEACDKGGCSGELVRRTRLDQDTPPPAVHFGLVASGDTVMKYGEERDRIAAQENVIAFEMEGAGLWDTFPCVVIKGACDYADSHKMKEWQCYAAATAASCAKAFLEYWVPSSRGNSRPNMMPMHGQEADGVRRGSASDVPASPPRKPCHHLPLRKNRKFVGRTSVMKILQQKLFDDDDQASTCVAVVGLGGVGKTQVALQMAYWTLQNKPEWHVFWVPALSMASFEQACRAIAQTVGLEEADKGDAKEALQHYLESDASGRWLLIVDNADDEEVVEGRKQGQEQGIFDFLPRTDRCRILFTTRVQEIAVRLAQSEVIDISQMEEHEAAELLGKSLINQSLLEDKKTVAKLLGLLTNLPLAIAQAAAYLNVTKAPVAEYMRLLQNTEHDEVELLETEFADDTRDHPRQHKTSNAVARTWVVSFEQIRKNADAAMLLSFIAQVEPRAIPRSMLPAVGSEQKMTSAIGVLCGYSFLSAREDEATYDMHRLVHVASRVWVSRQDTAGEQRRAALRHLGRDFSTDDWDERERWRPFLPHVLKAIEVDGKGGNWVEEECRLGYWAGRCLRVEGRSREAVKVLEQVVAVRETTLAETHPSRLASQHELASAYQADGRVKEAIVMLERVVAVQETTLAETHPSRLASQHTLASAYQADGRVKEAIVLLERVVAVRETTLAETHPDRLTSQHELARAYRADGRVKEAIVLLERVVAVRGTTQAETHPYRLASQHALAMAYRADGRVKEAIVLLERVVAVRETTLAETHPSRLASQHELASAYQADGRVKEAIVLLERVVAVRETTQAETHPDRLASQHELARAYQADGRVKEAIILLERVVAVRETTLAETHPDRLASQHNLATAYHDDGQMDRAADLLKHVVAVRQRTLSVGHPSRIGSERWLDFLIGKRHT